MISCTSLVPLSGNAESITKPKSNTLLNKANEAYLEKKYGKALRLYRTYLRKNRKDYDAWVLLAASYYHRAQPRRALKILLRFKNKTSLKSQSLFYLGLSYDVIGKLKSAHKYLRAASRNKDAFGSLAAFEIFALKYEEFEIKEALKWLKIYEKRFPKGAFINLVKSYRKKIESNEILTITESQRHAYRRDFYANHPSSLLPIEHTWAFQTGWRFSVESGLEPRENPFDPKKRILTPEYALWARLSLGIGPFRTGESKIWLAYNYLQNWFTDESRFAIYFDDFTDLNYFPLRPDLLHRRHQFSADFETPISTQWTLGVFAQLDFHLAGSSLYPAPERPEIKGSQDISTTTLIVPEIRWQIDKHNRLSLYSLFEKKIDTELTELSYQTFTILDFENLFMSLGLSHRLELPEYKLNVSTDGFYVSYVYNDDFEDHSSTGMSVVADKEFWDFKAAVRGLVNFDSYEKPSIQQYKCSPTSTEEDSLDEPINCDRKDLSFMIDAGLSYSFKDIHTVYSSISYLNAQNQANEVYSRSKFIFILAYSVGFPDKKESLRFLDAYKRIRENYEGLLP